MAAAQKIAGELEKLICKIYEDNALGKLPDARYKALDAQYAKEQDALEIEIAELEKAVNERGISSRTMRTAKSRIGDRLVTEKDSTAWVIPFRLTGRRCMLCSSLLQGAFRLGHRRCSQIR